MSSHTCVWCLLDTLMHTLLWWGDKCRGAYLHFWGENQAGVVAVTYSRVHSGGLPSLGGVLCHHSLHLVPAANRVLCTLRICCTHQVRRPEGYCLSVALWTTLPQGLFFSVPRSPELPSPQSYVWLLHYYSSFLFIMLMKFFIKKHIIKKYQWYRSLQFSLPLPHPQFIQSL